MRAVAQEQRASGGRVGFLSKIKNFFRESWLELQKVIWPSHEDVVKMTGLVVVVVVTVGLFMFVWDRVLWVLTQPLFE